MIVMQQQTAISNIHYVEKQEEHNHIVLIVVVVPTSRQPKNYTLFPIVFIYFVPYVRLVHLLNKSDRFEIIATQQRTAISNIHYVEKQQEDNHVILIIVVIPSSQQPKNYSFFPILIIYFVPYVILVRLLNKSDQFDSDAEKQHEDG